MWKIEGEMTVGKTIYEWGWGVAAKMEREVEVGGGLVDIEM